MFLELELELFLLPVLLFIALLGIPLSHNLFEMSLSHAYVLSSRIKCGFQGQRPQLRYSNMFHKVKHIFG